MKVLCGFLEPVICPYPSGTALNSHADYINYLDNNKHILGMSIIQKNINSKEFGITNDGTFYVEQNWNQGEMIPQEPGIVEEINKYIILPLQIEFANVPLERIQLKHIWMGEKDPSGIICRHVISPKSPTGKIVIDRFNERDEIKALLASNSFQNLHMWYQMRISKAYPHIQFRDSSQIDTVLNDFISWADLNPQISFSLLSQYLADSRQGFYREAFYAGIMLLEDLFFNEISKHKFAFDKTRIKKKLPILSLSETTFRNKIAILRHNNLYNPKLFKKEIERIAHLRNEVFHRGHIPDHCDLFKLHDVIEFFFSTFTKLQIPKLMIFNQHI